MPTIAEIAQGPDFSILLASIGVIDDNTDAELATTLSNPGTLTVFAPNNAAFGALAVGLGFAGDPADETAVTNFLVANVPVATLRAVVEYHVLGTVETAADIAGATTLTTLNGPTITPDLPTLVDNEPDAIDPSLVATDIAADNGIVHVVDRVLLPVDLPSITSQSFTDNVLALSGASGFDTNSADFDLLREALVATGLDTALDANALDATVFAPTDAAFVGLAQTLGFQGQAEGASLQHILQSLNLLNGNQGAGSLLQTVLEYHVSPESLQASQVLGATSIDTLAGPTLGVSGASLVDADPDLANPNLIATDIQASNGVLHVIDGVLLPVDVLNSDGANDVDFVIGSRNEDTIDTGADADLIDGSGGNDFISAGSGDDLVLGGNGSDVIVAGDGEDVIFGDHGRDSIFAGFGDDVIEGGRGADLIAGRAGDDDLMGQGGRDNLRGDAGADDLEGGVNFDTLDGGNGNDTLDGGAGRDLLTGGAGADVFEFDAGFANDIITDFTNGDDLIDLTDFVTTFGALTITATNGNTRVDVAGVDGGRIILRDVDDATITVDDFIF